MLHRVPAIVLLSLFAATCIIADTRSSYTEVLKREHTKFIQDMQNPRKNEGGWDLKNYSQSIAILGLNLFALNKLYSQEAQKLVSSIDSYIAETTLSKTPLAASWTSKLQHLSALVKNKLLMHVHLRTVFDLSKYALALYMTADTGKMLYESWVYEAAFESSGDMLDRMRLNLQVCDEKTNQLQVLLDKLVDIISERDEMNPHFNPMTRTYYDDAGKTTMSLTRIVQGLRRLSLDEIRNTRKRDNALFNQVVHEYEKIANEINASLDKSKIQIEVWRERTKLDQAHYLREKERYIKNGILAGGVAVFSLGLSTIFPPAALGAGVALKATMGVPSFTAILSAANFFGSFSSQKNLEKALYRIVQFDEMESFVDQFKQTTLRLVEQFKLQKKKWFRMLRRYERYQRTQTRQGTYQDEYYPEPITRTDMIIQFLVSNLGMCASFTLIIFALTSFILRQYSEHPLQPIQTFKWSIVLFGVCLMACMFVDLMQAKERTMQEMIHRSQTRASVQHHNLLQRYRRECIWYEIPVYRQIAMEASAFIFNWIPFLRGEYGFNSLTRNGTGHLVHDRTCLQYEEKMHNVQMNVQESNMEHVGNVYMQPIKGFGKVFSEVFADAMETLNERTSLLTKLWMLLVSVGILALAFRRFLFLFCC